MSDANRVQLGYRKETMFGEADDAIVSVPVFVPDDDANGTMDQPIAPNTAIKETWTATCTTPGGDGVGIFTITTSGVTTPNPATATVGTKYVDALGVSFTISAGLVDFDADDVFTFDVDAEFQIMRHTGESLKQDTTVVTSEEIRSDRQIADIIRTGVGASGGIDFELSYGTFDEFLQAILFSAGWSTEVLLPAALSALTFTKVGTADGTMIDVYADNAAPVETWTVTCTDIGTPAKFSVVGSVSGVKAEATAELAYDNDLIAFEINAGGSAFEVGDIFDFGVTRGKTVSVDSVTSFDELLTPVQIISEGDGEPADITDIASPGATPPTYVPSETWTMICTVADTTFSVVGSVTGVVTGKETATTGTPYDNGYIKFTIGDTVSDWDVGDEFIITNNFSGLIANQWIRSTGFLTDYTANNGWFKIVSVTSLKLVVSHGTLVTTSAGANINMQMGAQIVNGVELASWNIERDYKDLANVFSLFTGMCLGEMSLNVPADGRITGSFTLMGSKEKSDTASVGTGNKNATTTKIMTGANHVDDIFENKLEAKILSFAMSINNNLRTRLQVGTLGAVSIGAGTILITGSLELYLKDAVLFDKYLNQDPSSLGIGVTDGAGNGYVIEIPTLTITDGTRPAGGLNTDVVGTFEWQAYMNPIEEISVRITRFPVLA